MTKNDLCGKYLLPPGDYLFKFQEPTKVYANERLVTIMAQLKDIAKSMPITIKSRY